MTTSTGSDAAATWRLERPTTMDPAVRTTVPSSDGLGGVNSVINPDMRSLVNEEDIKDGGKYRSVVKIQSLAPNKWSPKEVWAMGTGWLIRPDLVVTAAHIVYHVGPRWVGATTQVKCYIGYNGRDSMQSQQAQARYGQSVAVPADWVNKRNQDREQNQNIAFIQLDKPFDGNLRLFTFSTTAETRMGILGVVGYPGDRYLRRSSGDDIEFGAQMYERYVLSNYNLTRSPNHMIEYALSTYLRQCGAPIVQEDRNTVIGTHCHGGEGYGNNSGTSICGPYGHDYQAFANIFDYQRSSFGTSDHIQFVDIHGRDSRTIMPAISSNGQFSSPQHGAIPTTPTMPATSPGNSSSASHSAGTSNWKGTPEIADAGGFFHVLHNVAQVDSAVDASLSCLLGPLSGLSSAAAGTLLACVCRVAMSIGGFTSMDGISERALAAEAALQAVLRLEPSPERGEVIHKMQIIWSANAPNLEGLASRLALALTQCALDIAVHRLSKTSDPRRMREGYVSFLPQRRYLDVGGGLPAAPRKRCPFVESLLQPTLVVVGEEELLGWLESVLEVAVSDEAPLVSQATRSALASIVPKRLGDSEFIPTQPHRDKDATLILFNRAMMADVALQALMDLPRQSLSRIDLKGREGQNMFDFIKTVLQKMGPSVSASLKKSFRELVPVLMETANNDAPRQPTA